MHSCILCNNILIKSDLSLLCENNFIAMFQLTLGCTRGGGRGEWWMQNYNICPMGSRKLAR